jgi:gluconate kinase
VPDFPNRRPAHENKKDDGARYLDGEDLHPHKEVVSMSHRLYITDKNAAEVL